MTFIAEIGMNYNGHLGLAFELIKQAKLCGADIAKFQLGWRDGEGEINQLDAEKIAQLKKCAEYNGIELMFSIISEKAFELIKPFNVNRYKVASRTVKDKIDLVEKIIAEGKNTIISLGMWEGKGLPFEPNEKISYLWCKSEYPTMPWQMLDFPKEFSRDKYTGYSDHTLGIDTVLMAISRGAKIIEKHFTLDKSDTTIRDHALSATPQEFELMVKLGHEIEKKVELGI